MSFQDLPHVHPRGDAEGIQYDLHRSAVGKVGHFLHGQDPGDHALVPVTAGHLVAHGQFPLHGDVGFDHLDDAGRQLIPLAELGDFLLRELPKDSHLPLRALADLRDFRLVGLLVVDVETQKVVDREARQNLLRENRVLG